MRFILALALLWPQISFAIDGRWLDHLVQHRLAHVSEDVVTYSYPQTLDHFDAADARKFDQRYEIFPAQARGDHPPVLLYEGGEENAFNGGLPSGVLEAATNLGAVVIVLEHRFYGGSQPFHDLSTAHLKYLTYEQAIEDTAEFQRYAMKSLHYDGRWIIVGGSYPGALAAYYRLRHPELVAGALSSSGVVRAVEAYENYDYFVAKGLGEKCRHTFQAATRTIEQQLKSGGGSQVRALFNSSNIREDLDFLTVIATIPSLAVQYGQAPYFCGHLAAAEDVVSELAKLGSTLFSEFHLEPVDVTPQGAMATSLDGYETDIGFRQWYWQSCTEFGGFAVAYHDPEWSISSPRLNLHAALVGCQRIFGEALVPDVDRVNHDYYEPLLQASTSRILYTNGSTDPYAPLSISRENGDATDPNTTAFTIRGGSHCSDLGGSLDPEVVHAREFFQSLARVWITRDTIEKAP